MTHARVEPDLKHETEEVLSALAFSAAAAITLSYKQVSLQRGLPSEIRIPNAETREAIRQAQAREGLTRHDNVKGLMAEFDDA